MIAMRIGKILTLLALTLSVSTLSARTPDNDDIYAKIADSNSAYYYPGLKMRYDQWVEPMSAEARKVFLLLASPTMVEMLPTDAMQ